ncbi:unnamed protein product [Alopecurus aequalis]
MATVGGGVGDGEADGSDGDPRGGDCDSRGGDADGRIDVESDGEEHNSEMWELYIQFDGVKFVQKTMRRSDIRFLNLLSVMEKEGYGLCDTMYYVRDEGEGLDGLAAVDSNDKVEEMVKKYESSKKLVLTVMRDKKKHGLIVSPIKSNQAGKSHPIHIDLDVEEDEHITVQLQTQSSVNYVAEEQEEEDKSDEGSDSESDSWWDEGQYDPGKAEQLRKAEEEELKKTIAEMKKKRADPLLHCDGDTDVEDIFVTDQDGTEEIIVEEPVKKKVKRQGPTTRSHSQVDKPKIAYWTPDADVEEAGFLKEEDDDGFEPVSFVQPKGRKSRAKKAKERVWYDEHRENAEQQFMLNLCFKDVYQFRHALTRLHISQVRNFHYHRNCKDRIIVWCKEKDKYGYEFFMLKYAIGGDSGKYGPYTIMSDRQKGLVKAVSTVFPNSPVRYCLRHIYANFQTSGFRGEDLKKCMDNAAYSYTRDKFDIAMEELKKQCEPAWVWLSKIPVHTWARWAMDTNCKTDLVVNNLSEVLNRYILDVRSKPIVTMLVGIYDKQMVRFDEKRTGDGTAKWEITPHYAERLEMMKKYSRDCVPLRSDLGLWHVKSGNHTEEVNLDVATCSCRKWDMAGLPCNHDVSAIYKARMHPEDFVSDFLKKPMYINSYRNIFCPMPEEHGWTKTDTPDIMPPSFNDHLRGRRQEKRRKGKFEVPKPKQTSRMATITCKNCKLQGHKYVDCLKELRPDLAMRKNNHRSRRSLPDKGPSTDTSATSTVCSGSSAAPRAPPVADPRPPPGATHGDPRPPPRATHDDPRPPPRASFTAPRPAGFMAYLNAGANAGRGRDASEDPLARNRDSTASSNVM